MAMRRFTLSFLTVASLIFVIQLLSAPDFSIAATWYHTDWHYRKSLTIDNTKVSGANDLNDFSIFLNYQNISSFPEKFPSFSSLPRQIKTDEKNNLSYLIGSQDGLSSKRVLDCILNT